MNNHFVDALHDRAHNYSGSLHQPWNMIPLGLEEHGEFTWDTLLNPSMLIVGHVGSGKSIIQRGIIAHCIQHSHNWTVYGIDLTGVELNIYLKYSDTVKKISFTLEDTVSLLRELKKEHDCRLEKIACEKKSLTLNDPESQIKAIMLIIDQMPYLKEEKETDSEIEKEQNELIKEILTLIETIARYSKATGISIAVGAQYLTTQVLPAVIKNNLSLRYGVGRLDPVTSMSLFGEKVEHDVPSGVRGVATVRTNNGLTRVQNYYLDPNWIDNFLEKHQE